MSTLNTNPASAPRYGKIPARQHKQLGERPNMEHLKGQAKALLRGYLAGEVDAVRRVRRFQDELPPVMQSHAYPRPVLRLKDAQHVIAREYAAAWKFRSWEDLKSHVDAINNCSDEFIDQQIGRMTRSESPDTFNQYRFLGSLKTRIVPHLIRALKTSTNACVRANCLSFLDHLDFTPDAEFVNAVTAALDDPVPRVRRTALHTLSCERCKSVPVPLTAEHVRKLVMLCVADENAKVRRSAEGLALMLAKQQGSAARETLQKLCESRNEELRQRALALMARLK
jgi:hypothetical protein